MQCANAVNILYLRVSRVREHTARIFSKEAEGMVTDDDSLRKPDVHSLGKRLMSALFKDMGLSTLHQSLNFHPYGKPYIPSGVSFNISHSEDIVICASVVRGEIGIDIELKRLLDWPQYKNSFSPDDWRLITSAIDPSSKLLELWTKKESLLKADGRGLQVPLSDVICNDRYGWIASEKKNWHFNTVSIEGYCCHVCTEFHFPAIILREADYLY